MAEAVKIFESQLEENDRQENYAFCKKLRPHCESLVQHMKSEFSRDQSTFVERLTPFVDLDIVINWLHALASFCHENSYCLVAKSVVDLACNLLENTDDNSTSALTRKERIFNISGIVYCSLREYNHAKELHKKALAISTNVFGEDHPNVATSYNNLASVYYRLAEYNKAKELHEKALMIRKNNFGEDHADVAKSYSTLAPVYYSMGEYNQAKELHKKSPDDSQKDFW